MFSWQILKLVADISTCSPKYFQEAYHCNSFLCCCGCFSLTFSKRESFQVILSIIKLLKILVQFFQLQQRIQYSLCSLFGFNHCSPLKLMLIVLILCSPSVFLSLHHAGFLLATMNHSSWNQDAHSHVGYMRSLLAKTVGSIYYCMKYP